MADEPAKKKEVNQDFRDIDMESLGEEHINLVFKLGLENFGVDVNMVREIVRVPSFITRVPNAPAYIRGVINLRGTIVPVFDMHMKIGMAGHPHRRGKNRSYRRQ